MIRDAMIRSAARAAMAAIGLAMAASAPACAGRPVADGAAAAANESAVEAVAPGERVVFADRFDGAPGPGWTWLRENPAAWRVRGGALEIRVEPGLAETVKNALVRPAPDRAAGRYAIEATITNATEPTQQYEQAGITWYRDGKAVFKFVKERVDGKLVMVPGMKPMASATVQLRLVVDAAGYRALYRPDGRGEFLEAAAGKLPPPGAPEQVSIQCYHGPTDAEHWIRFDDFRILALPPP